MKGTKDLNGLKKMLMKQISFILPNSVHFMLLINIIEGNDTTQMKVTLFYLIL